MGEKQRLSIPTGMGIKILLPTLLVVGLFSLPALLAWRETQTIQEQNTSMRDYTRSLLVVNQLATALQNEMQTGVGIDTSVTGLIDRQRQETGQRSERIRFLQQTVNLEPESAWFGELADINQSTTSLLEGSTAQPAAADAGQVREQLLQNHL